MVCLWWRSWTLLALRSPGVHKHLCSHLYFRYCKVLSPREIETPSKVIYLERTKEMELFVVPLPLRPDSLRCSAQPGMVQPLPGSLASSLTLPRSLCSDIWADPPDPSYTKRTPDQPYWPHLRACWKRRSLGPTPGLELKSTMWEDFQKTHFPNKVWGALV